MADAAAGPIGWERALMAAEKVKERLRRATKALDDAGVPYAVVGGNAVAEWVARVDEDAVRNTRDVDLLIRRIDLPAARTALEAAGFVYYQLLDVDMFIDGPQGTAERRGACPLRRREGAAGLRTRVAGSRRVGAGGRISGGDARRRWCA